jgi:GT2 family glycosyltransferase
MFIDSNRTARNILVIVVLYRRPPHESASLCSLAQILKDHPELTRNISLVLFDNSPQSQQPEVELNCPLLYKHDPANPGLAAAYNFALNLAGQKQCEWLLLLDQDTSLTTEFMIELMECTRMLADRTDVSSIVPKLIVAGKIYSPAAHFIDQLRHQYRYWRSGPGVSGNVHGIQEGRLSAYNSGAALRVSALRSIGGFPAQFWLDYLDHAVFHTLHMSGYKMYVMRASVPHDSSQLNVSSVPVWRQRNILAAQTLFVLKTANFVDRFFYRIWLLRYSRSLWLNRADKQLWREAAILAFRLTLRPEVWRPDPGI